MSKPVAIGDHVLAEDRSGCKIIARDQVVNPNLIVIDTLEIVKGRAEGCAIEVNPEQALHISTELKKFAEMKQRGG